jgi:carbon monoxide dehydrogenase subunit G
MHLEGDKDFSLPIDFVFARLSDAAFLAHCLNDVEIVRAETDAAEWKLRPALAFVAGTLDISLTITERNPPTAMKAIVFSKGIGATVTVETVLSLTPADSGSKVRWTLDVTQLTGLLKLVPKSLMQGAALKVVEDVWEQIMDKLKSEENRVAENREPKTEN